jgi:hypothetical protein
MQHRDIFIFNSSNPIKKKTIPGIPIDVVAVNYAVFAISIFINYYL